MHDAKGGREPGFFRDALARRIMFTIRIAEGRRHRTGYLGQRRAAARNLLALRPLSEGGQPRMRTRVGAEFPTIGDERFDLVRT